MNTDTTGKCLAIEIIEVPARTFLAPSAQVDIFIFTGRNNTFKLGIHHWIIQDVGHFDKEALNWIPATAFLIVFSLLTIAAQPALYVLNGTMRTVIVRAVATSRPVRVAVPLGDDM